MKKLYVYLIFITCLFLTAQEWINISPLPESDQWFTGDFISAEEGWAYCNNSISRSSIFHTDDGGNSWKKIYVLEDSTETIRSLNMIDTIVGWATITYNTNYKFYKTPDGGRSWMEMNSFLPDPETRSLYFVNRDIGFLEGGYDPETNSAIIYKTVNGGWNWYRVETPVIYDPFSAITGYYINNFFFLDENHGWAGCGTNYAIGSGAILYTSDGGETWEGTMEDDLCEVYKIQFIDQNTGCAKFIGDYFNYPGFTFDNFETIKYVYYNSASICFQNDSTIWIAEDNGNIYRSTDCGENFELYQTVDETYFGDFQFFKNTGFLNGYDGIYKFVDDSSIEQEFSGTVEKYELNQNYPNPFNPVTEIGFDLTKTADVKLRVYNINGQLVQELVNEIMIAGSYSVDFNGINLNSGIYYYQLDVNGRSMTKRMVLLK